MNQTSSAWQKSNAFAPIANPKSQISIEIPLKAALGYGKIIHP
jgi:hypothetical protein